MKKLDLLTIYELFARIVEHSNGADQINTFVVLRDNGLINADNLGKTLNYQNAPRQVFYSRRWKKEGFPSDKIQWDFPILVLNQNFIQFKNPFETKGERRYQFKLYLLDKIENEIFEIVDVTVERLFIKVIQQFAQCYEVNSQWYCPHETQEGKRTSQMLSHITTRQEGQAERLQETFSTTKATGIEFNFTVKVPNVSCN